jgi:hypothetical protein
MVALHVLISFSSVRADYGFGAMRAAVNAPLHFDAMSHDAAAAVLTGGRQTVNGAFKTVEGMRLPIQDDLE